MYAGVGPATALPHIQRFHVTLTGAVGSGAILAAAALPVYPDHAVFGKAETMVLLEVNKSGHAGGKGQDGEDRGGQLELKFLKHSDRGTRSASPASAWHTPAILVANSTLSACAKSSLPNSD